MASKGFIVKCTVLCALVSKNGGHFSFERVFETLIDDYLNRHSPEKRTERWKNKKAKTNDSKTLTQSAGAKWDGARILSDHLLSLIPI